VQRSGHAQATASCCRSFLSERAYQVSSARATASSRGHAEKTPHRTRCSVRVVHWQPPRQWCGGSPASLRRSKLQPMRLPRMPTRLRMKRQRGVCRSVSMLESNGQFSSPPLLCSQYGGRAYCLGKSLEIAQRLLVGDLLTDLADINLIERDWCLGAGAASAFRSRVPT
jgi:hypothetical protein